MRTLGIILLIISSITLYITKFTLDSNEQLYNPWVTKSSSPLVVFLYSIHRIEPLIGLKAISDKPLIGHGSHTKTNFYTRWAIQQGIITKYQMTGEREEMIPVHSVVLTSMVEGGIFAGLLWIFIVFYLLKSIPNMLFRSPRKYAIVAVLMVMDSMWNIFFSPLGYARFDLPIIFGFIWALNTYHLRVKANPTPNFGQVAI
ncbi:MAG: hypothetical protein ABIV51_13250 [Saprospiraceae bacterium]